MKCSKCGQEYTGNFCPNCGAPSAGNNQEIGQYVQQTKKKNKGFGCMTAISITVAVVLVLAFIGTATNKSDDAPAEKPSFSISGTESQDTQEYDDSADWSIEQKNAMRAAKSYLSVMNFSRSGLAKQLEYDQYSTEAATWAADNCKADWNEQALGSAKAYLNTMAFSASGLQNQLEHDGYTSEEAAYGVSNCSADWNEQAAKAAKSYLDIMAFSAGDLQNQLEHDGYTPEQAAYGVSQNGY